MLHFRSGYRGKVFVFLFFSVILLVFLSYSFLFQASAVFEILIAIACLALIFLFDRRYNLSLSSIVLLSCGALLNPLGIFGLYSYFILSGPVGYDKVIHFFSAFALTYGILDIQKENMSFLNYAVAVLIVMGLGSFIEIVEFIGEIYFGIDTGGIFNMVDSLPSVKSDLQRYDTHYDMIFNLIGAISSVLFVFFRDLTRGEKCISLS
jgi:uncharacterized membrane protein YjdF